MNLVRVVDLVAKLVTRDVATVLEDPDISQGSPFRRSRLSAMIHRTTG